MKNNMYTPKEYTEVQLAYLAGIIDGEGSIYIGNFSRTPIGKILSYQTNITISNCDKILIEWLSNVFGGPMSEYTPNQTPKNSRKKVYLWRASGERLTHLCILVLPYLVIKKRQCEIMIEMRKTFERTGCAKGNPGVIYSVTEEILEKRKSLFDELRSLHCRNRLK